MDVRLLRYFLVVAQEKNISRAADVLHITQPTLSRQLSQMEEELNTILFTRGRNFALTESGLLLKRRAEDIVTLMDRLDAEFSESKELTGTISLGCGGQRASAIMIDYLQEFQSLHPYVTYNIYTNNADNIRERLDSGVLDFGVLLEPTNIERYEYIRLDERDHWGLLMNSNHSLANEAIIRSHQLEHIPLLSTNRVDLQNELNHWLQQSKEHLNVQGTYTTIDSVLSLIRTHDDIAALTIEGATANLDPHQFVFKPLEPSLSMSSVLVWKPSLPVLGAAAKFLEYIRLHYSNTVKY